MANINNYWENSDLVRRLCYTLDIAKQTVENLEEKSFTHPEDFNYSVPPEKIIAETAFILLAASAVGAYIEVENKIDELANILIPYARNQKTLFNICHYPALALDYAHPHICLTKLGYLDSNFDALLVKTIDSHSHLGCERTPYRMIEQEWIKKVWNNIDTSIDKLISYTLLAHPIDLLHGSREDRYAFTHALMYSSELNITSMKLPRKGKEIIDEADAMLAKSIDEQDYDLASELLLSWPLMEEPWSTASVFAFHILVRILDEIEFLPSPGIQIQIPQKLENGDRKRNLFSTTYHTIYVMGLLCSVILQHRRNPPKEIPKNNSIGGSAKKIMSFLKQHGDTPYWISVYDGLNEHEQDSLASFLFNVALIRNTRKKDYENLYQLLKIGHELGLTDTAIARQTAELLERINLLSHLLSEKALIN